MNILYFLLAEQDKQFPVLHDVLLEREISDECIKQ